MRTDNISDNDRHLKELKEVTHLHRRGRKGWRLVLKNLTIIKSCSIYMRTNSEYAPTLYKEGRTWVRAETDP